jgi:hypothetical protein
MGKFLFLLSITLTLIFSLILLDFVLPQDCFLTVEAGGPYIKTSSSPKVLIAGNVSSGSGPASNANVTIKIYEGYSLKATKELTASSEGKFYADFESLDKGNYTANITANYSSSTCEASNEFEIKESLSGCKQMNISLAGLARDFLTGEDISGNVTVLIKESGDESSKSFDSGKWSLSFTACLIQDQRYTAIIQVTDLQGRKSWVEIKFRV